MPKHVLIWKAVKSKTIRDTDCYIRIMDRVDRYYKGTLLTCILTMKKKQPISLESAVTLFSKEWINCVLSRRAEECEVLDRNFVNWVSEKGYHIELTGDEFEPVAMSDKVF